MAEKNKVKLTIENTLNDVHNVFGDLCRIRQILNNLVGNAIKFSHGGEVTIRLSKEPNENGSIHIRFEVEDNGIGIPEEKRHLLFQKFSQIDTSTTKKYGGTGLGLAICKSLVDIMEGDIGVESKVGKGSLFWFSIPLEEKDAYIQDNAAGGNIHVLFVGMNMTNAYVFSQYVDKCNIPHETADSVSEAVDRLYQAKDSGNPYTAVIIGEEIPEQSRLVLAHTLKNDYNFKDMDLLLVSNFGLGQEWKKYEKAGFSTNLVLPVHQQSLLNSLRRAG